MVYDRTKLGKARSREREKARRAKTQGESGREQAEAPAVEQEEDLKREEWPSKHSTSTLVSVFILTSAGWLTIAGGAIVALVGGLEGANMADIALEGFIFGSIPGLAAIPGGGLLLGAGEALRMISERHAKDVSRPTDSAACEN